jgi:hypothetical protein
MQHVDAKAIENTYAFQSSVDITRVCLEWGTLVVTLISGGDRKAATVRFSEIAGFRLLDEGNLLEFWPECSGVNGWLFLIKKNGWLDQESTRDGFLLEKDMGLSEYFIASQNSCVSVLSSEVPRVEMYSI